MFYKSEHGGFLPLLLEGKAIRYLVHKDFFHRWYCVFVDTVQITWPRTHTDPVVGAVVCFPGWAKQSLTAFLLTARPHCCTGRWQPLESTGQGRQEASAQEGAGGNRAFECLVTLFQGFSDSSWKNVPSLKMSSETSSPQLYPSSLKKVEREDEKSSVCTVKWHCCLRRELTTLF